MFDSRFLLSLYAKSAFSKIARNKANKEIAKATEAQGNESWVSKTDKPGFSEVTYFEDGTGFLNIGLFSNFSLVGFLTFPNNNQITAPIPRIETKRIRPYSNLRPKNPIKLLEFLYAS
jgi:hypothetical protein